MTLQEFAQQVKEENPTITQCYIAIMEIDGQYDLEVEIDQDTIGGVYRTEDADLDYARTMADELEKNLKTLGVRVFSTRENWEMFCRS